jgi:peptidoglycan hydrolase-like protein with peptidoglycan-binding domain
MKIITDSFIKNIVRQSLNENYGLLNEYDITTTRKIDNIPIGSTIKNMTLPQCPDGGFCYGTLAQAKKDVENLSAGGSSGLIQKYCPSKNVPSRKGKGIKMGEPTYNTTKIQSVSAGLWEQLTDTFMDDDIIRQGLEKLENFPNFCKSEELYYGYVKTIIKNDEIYRYNGFEGNNYYGINNDDVDQANSYYLIIAQLFQNTIQNTEEAYPKWVAELNANYKATKDAADLVNKAAEEKKNTENKIKGGGGQQVEWLKKHPALIDNPKLVDIEGGDKATLYSLDTSDPVVNQYQYGVRLVNAPGTSAHETFQDVRVKKGTDVAITIDPDTDKFWQFAISQNDAWRYDGVAWAGSWEGNGLSIADKSKIALTTSPDLEDDEKINKSIQTERTKGFRHNLLTEVELKYKEKPYLESPDVVAIQKKLDISTVGGYGPETKRKVAAFQKENGITPVTGDVDEATWAAIMAKSDPPSATGYTRVLNIGSTGPDVEAIQTKLKSKKGKYSTDTETAVMDYQKKYTDLPDSGVVDEKTFNHIMTNTKLGVDVPISYSGKKHNYKKGDWISIKPNSGSDATQLYENNGYFRILDTPDDYTIVIDADWTKGVTSYTLAGGTTAKVIFGPDAVGGVKTIPTVSDNSTKGTRNKVDNSGTRSKGSTSSSTSSKGDGDIKKVSRNTEFCNNLIEIKKYLNTNKGSNLRLNCQKTRNTINQIMLALTGGAQIKPVTPVTPVDQPANNVVQSVPVTDRLF